MFHTRLERVPRRRACQLYPVVIPFSVGQSRAVAARPQNKPPAHKPSVWATRLNSPAPAAVGQMITSSGLVRPRKAPQGTYGVSICNYKIPLAPWLQTTGIYSLAVLKAGSPKSRCLQGSPPSEGRKGPLLASSSFCGLARCCLAPGRMTPGSACLQWPSLSPTTPVTRFRCLDSEERGSTSPANARRGFQDHPPAARRRCPGTWLRCPSRNLICQQLMRLFINFFTSPRLHSESPGRRHGACRSSETSTPGAKNFE